MRRHDTADPFLYYRRLRRLRRCVLNDMRYDLTAADAAAIVGLERHYFSSWFRSLAGLTYTQWISDLRLQRAERLFRTHNYGVLEVALESGFGSEDSFRRACKRYRGVTPAEMKRRAVAAEEPSAHRWRDSNQALVVCATIVLWPVPEASAQSSCSSDPYQYDEQTQTWGCNPACNTQCLNEAWGDALSACGDPGSVESWDWSNECGVCGQSCEYHACDPEWTCTPEV